MPLPPVRSWTVEPTFRLLARCDRCHRRRLFAPYYEVHGTADEDHSENCPNCGDREPGHGVWWWECYSCLIDTLTSLLESGGWWNAPILLEERLNAKAPTNR